MATKEIVTDYNDPFQVADLAKREGAEGLLRLADYYETTGQQTPPTVKTALAMSRGPGVFPEAGAFLQKAKPPTDRVTRLRRSGQASPDLEAFLARTGAVREQREAKRAVEAASRLPKIQGAEISAPVRSTPAFMSVPDALRPSDWVTARPTSALQQTSPMNQLSLGVVPVPPPDSRSADLLGPFFKPVDEASLPPEGIRLPVEEAPTMMAPARVAASRTEAAQTAPEATVPPPAAPAIAPVPTATGPSPTAAAPSATVTKALTTLPPPPAAPVAGSGGDADLDRLALGQSLIQGLETFGSAVSGKNLRSGMAESLGERYRQAQALQAKRAEKEIGDVEERTNLNAAIDSYKRLFPDQADALDEMRGSTNKPAVLREALNAWRQKMEWEKGKLPVAQATVAQKEAGVTRTLGQAATDEALRPGKVEKLAADTELSRARKEKVYKDMALEGAKLALEERKALDDAQKTKDPFKKLESLNTIADKKEFGGFTTLAGDLSTLERIAPGFVTRGEVPDWLTREQQLLGQNWPTSTDPRVVDFLAAYGKVANEERHRQYGSAQTDGELRSFMSQLNSNPLSAGPRVLAQQVKRFADAAGRVAKGRLTRYNNVFGAENVDTVFSPEWKPLFDKDGVFAAQGSPFAAAAPSAAAPASAPSRKPSAQAIANLKADPSPTAKAEYDAWFGAGSAARDLGEGR